MDKLEKRPTIRDVAKEAGVSYQTVSRVINGSDGVAPSTRKHIQKVIQRIDYRPNKVAQMMSTQRSQTLQLVEVGVDYRSNIYRSLKTIREAKAADYSVLLTDTHEGGLVQTIEAAASRMVDGLLFYAPQLQIADEDLTALCQGIPFVRRDYALGSKLTWVGFDQVHATKLALDHLFKLGHRHIAEISGPLSFINPAIRHQTWLEFLELHGLNRGPSAEGDYSMRSGYEGANTILSSGRPFSAVLVGNDNMALGALRALREAGLRIPEDVSVVGMDDAEHAPLLEPPLTTVRFAFELQDEFVTRYLLERIRNPQTPHHQHVLLSELVVRESTGPAPRF